ncbi:hypothetical protein FRC02_011525 [Tulasnella sp. 418]|nr:hypothetical protein FRC02_011525 [Tulasnella sp. 418]
MGEIKTIRWPLAEVPPYSEYEEDDTTSGVQRLVVESTSHQDPSHDPSSSVKYVSGCAQMGPAYPSTSSSHRAEMYASATDTTSIPNEECAVNYGTTNAANTFPNNPFQPLKNSRLGPLQLIPQVRREESLLEDMNAWLLPSPDSGGLTWSSSTHSVPSPNLSPTEDQSFNMPYSINRRMPPTYDSSAGIKCVSPSATNILQDDAYREGYGITYSCRDEQYPVDLNNYQYEVDRPSSPPLPPTPPPRPAIGSQVPCLSCQEPCVLSRTPLLDYKKATATRITPGLILPCPFDHTYCLHCFRFHVNVAMLISQPEGRQSPLTCYHCSRLGYPDWKMEMDVVASAFSPGEVWKWRSKPFLQAPPEPAPIPRPSPARLAIRVRSQRDHQAGEAESSMRLRRANAISVHPGSPESKPKVEEPDSVCGICMESFYAVDYPIAMSLANAGKDEDRKFGLALACPRLHKYCLDCINQYIRTELEKGGEGRIVFPMKCPECSRDDWAMTDEVAERVLGQDVLNTWHFQKLLESIEKIYCPHPSCSALVEVPDVPGLEEATCPACQRMICVKCKTPWHPALSCAENKLPQLGQTDQQTYNLAKRSGWRRCPKCRMIVERSEGCPHMTCRCGTHFCYRCGSAYVRGACPLGARCQDMPDESLTVDFSTPSPKLGRIHRFFRKIGLRH